MIAAAVPMTTEQAQAYTALAVFSYVGLAVLLAIAVHRTIRQARTDAGEESPAPAELVVREQEAAPLPVLPPATDSRGLLVDRYL